MSEIVQVNFRMPAELKEKLENSARVSGRSITSELVTRLEESFMLEDKPYKVPLPADFHGVQGVMPLEMGAFIMELAMERAEQIRQDKNKSG